MRTLPFGTWPSPISPESLVAGQVRIDEVRVDGADTYWLEGRPHEGGRVALVRHDGTASATDLLPAPWDVRTRVHEYGGGAYAVERGTVVFSHVGDDRVFRLDPGSTEPVALTPPGPWRFGGLVLRGEHVSRCARTTPAHPSPPTSSCAWTSTGTTATVAPCCRQARTSSRARPCPPTARPWRGWCGTTRTCPGTRPACCAAGWRADGVTDVEVVAGGDGIAVVQPHFGPDGALWFVSDASGWWVLHRDTGAGPAAVHSPEADHASPPWGLGAVDLAVLDGDRVLVRCWGDRGPLLGVLDARTGVTTPVDVEGVSFDSLHAVGADVAFRRGLTDRLPEVVRGPLGG